MNLIVKHDLARGVVVLAFEGLPLRAEVDLTPAQAEQYAAYLATEAKKAKAWQAAAAPAPDPAANVKPLKGGKTK